MRQETQGNLQKSNSGQHAHMNLPAGLPADKAESKDKEHKCSGACEVAWKPLKPKSN
jgi:hypothetical protein